jgi:hypothetical protein
VLIFFDDQYPNIPIHKLQPQLQALPGQNTPANVPSFKLIIVGDGGTGNHVRSMTLRPAG